MRRFRISQQLEHGETWSLAVERYIATGANINPASTSCRSSHLTRHIDSMDGIELRSLACTKVFDVTGCIVIN